MQTVFIENLHPHSWNKSSNDFPKSSITSILKSPENPYDLIDGIPTKNVYFIYD